MRQSSRANAGNPRQVAEKLIGSTFIFLFSSLTVSTSSIGGIFSVSGALTRLRWTHYGLDLRGRQYGSQISYAHQIVGGAGEGNHPMDFAHPAMTHLAHQRDRLQPAEAFLNPLSLSLAESISCMSRGTTINCATTAPCEILRHGFVFFGLSAVQLDQSRSK